MWPLLKLNFPTDREYYESEFLSKHFYFLGFKLSGVTESSFYLKAFGFKNMEIYCFEEKKLFSLQFLSNFRTGGNKLV